MDTPEVSEPLPADRTAPAGDSGPRRVAILGPGGIGGLLAARLERVGMDVRVRDDELWMLWAKLSVLAPIALLGTHEGAPIGEVRERRRDDFAAVVHEITEAARAADRVELDPEVPLGMLDQVPAAMRSSRDAEAGKPLELDAIGGTILRAAARGGVRAPVTERLVSEIGARVVPS